MYSLAVWTNSWYTMWSAVNPIPKSADVGCKWAGMPRKKRYFKQWFRKYQKFVYFQCFDEFLIFPQFHFFQVNQSCLFSALWRVFPPLHFFRQIKSLFIFSVLTSFFHVSSSPKSDEKNLAEKSSIFTQNRRYFFDTCDLTKKNSSIYKTKKNSWKHKTRFVPNYA